MPYGSHVDRGSSTVSCFDLLYLSQRAFSLQTPLRPALSSYPTRITIRLRDNALAFLVKRHSMTTTKGNLSPAVRIHHETSLSKVA